jgi:hypothetical protein
MNIDAQISKISPEEKDIIVITVKERLTQAELQELLDKANQAFPNNNVVIMPETFDVEACDSSDLQEAIEKLQEIRIKFDAGEL